MSSEDVKTGEDSDMAECDGKNVVTMMDVLKEQQDFEDDANAVLGASDDKNCTYSKGYVKRQAIYACMTCCPEAKTDPMKRAGVCLACSLHCHENHELVELYTKRNFRCDCGNPKFNSSCQFTPSKMDLNYENRYNQNFSGVYCICHRPYPDPENTEEDEMIQCVVCEDWLHTNHLNATVPVNDQYEEMVCQDCMEDNDFLHDYTDIVINVVDKEIIITDPDLDINLESYLKKDSLVNGNSKADENLPGNVDSSTEEPKNDTQTSIEDKKEEVSTDVEMQETKCEDNFEPSEKTMEEKEPAIPEDQKTTDNTTTELNKEQVDPEPSTIVETETKVSESIAEPIANSDIIPETEQKQTSAPKEQSDTETNSEDAEKKSDENMPDQKTKTEEIDEAMNEKMEEDKLLNDEPEIPDETDKHDTVDSKADSESSEKTTEEEKNTKEKTTEEEEDKTTEEEENTTEEEEKTTEEEKTAEEKTTEEEKTMEEETKTASSEVIEPVADCLDIQENTVSNKETPEGSEKITEEGIKIASSDATAAIENGVDRPENTMKNKETSEASDITDEEMKNVCSDATEPVENGHENKRKLSTEGESPSAKKAKVETRKCTRPRGVKHLYKGATFWPSDFRQKLCTCNECISMYKDLAVLFLTDADDTVTAYEALGKEIAEGPSSQYEKGLQALSSLDRVQQINALTEYNKMKDKLLDFLKSFKDKKEIVKEEDIKAFFAGMKPKREPDGVYFCR